MSVSKIVSHIREAQELANGMGIKNILQPGIVKELMLAEILGHNVIPDKDKADATDNDDKFYEYLCSLEKSNNFQLDRVTGDNLNRITRNAEFYFAFFRDAITVSEVYRVPTAKVHEEANRQLAGSKNDISHMNMGGGWVRANGTKVYPGIS